MQTETHRSTANRQPADLDWRRQRRAITRRRGDVWQVAFAAACDAIKSGPPEWCPEHSDYDWFLADYEAHIESSVKTVLREHRFDPSDDATWELAVDAIEHAGQCGNDATWIAYAGDGDYDQRAGARAFTEAVAPSPPAPPIVLLWRAPAGRTSHGTRPVHRRGSRRTASRAGARGDPDLDGESDPPAVSAPPSRRETAGAVR